jgi:hypothetical protein
MWLTALPPPPPTPMTLITAFGAIFSISSNIFPILRNWFAAGFVVPEPVTVPVRIRPRSWRASLATVSVARDALRAPRFFFPFSRCAGEEPAPDLIRGAEGG